MQGALFLAIMIAVAWLVIWVCLDRSNPGTWWPFDYKDDDEPPAADTGPPIQPWRQQRHLPKQRWKRSGY